MNLDRQFLKPSEPRSRLICRYIEHWLDGQVGQQQVYADDVRVVYEARTQPDERIYSFHHTGDAVADTRANAQIVMRIIRGAVHLKSDIEEAMVLALPKKQRADLLRLVSARYGLLAVSIPKTSAPGVAADLARLVKEFGEGMEAYGELIEGDGVIDKNDSLAKLERGLAETDDIMAALSVFQASIQKAIREKKNNDE